jgi:hypothetical protein
MEVSTGRIPQDIDAVFEFASQDETATVYKFIISNDEITLLKNGKTLTSNIIKYGREKIAIYRQNGEWTIEFAGKKAFEYRDKTETGAWNMTIGYSGIGKGEIFIRQIIIENHLK